MLIQRNRKCGAQFTQSKGIHTLERGKTTRSMVRDCVLFVNAWLWFIISMNYTTSRMFMFIHLFKGMGTQVWKKSSAIYQGEWKFGKPDGCGTYSVLLPETKEYEKKYSGMWKNGKKHGSGTYFYKNSAVYEGEWGEGNRSGWGRMYYDNGDIYEGEWMWDKSHGQGLIKYTNGNWYEGAWEDGKRNGNGKFYFSDQGQLYEGFWADGIAKCGILSDFGRDQAPKPTKYPIPPLELKEPQSVFGIDEQQQETP
uniref:MORN repeat-containing protein 3 n=1 Tax=Scophthalmus maximus TaxID=52904 RepID=A0A8D3D9X5_SCOMX